MTLTVIEAVDSVKGQRFYRPPGGGIEFGEASAVAARREIREEMNVEIDKLRYLGALENIFSYNGVAGHEIVQVYEASFADHALYGKSELQAVESNGTVSRALWKAVDSLCASSPLYPQGLREFLRTAHFQSAPYAPRPPL